jgi:hypothetical protein
VNAESVVADGLAAWRRGDLDELERLFDPAVTLRAIQPGPWDCEDRHQLMELLRTRLREQGDSRAGADITVKPVDGSTFLVSGLGGGPGTATLVTLASDRVIAMQQVSAESVDQSAQAAVAAIRSGYIEGLQRILTGSPQLASGPVPGFQGRTMLHIVTDWPGYWPNGPEIVHILLDHGADPNHRGGDNQSGETPLHWAASSDDADVAHALLDGGADLEAPDGSIGTPLDNAVGYGCFNVAQLLAAHGARVDKLWHAAALGQLERLDELLTSNQDRDEISQALWHACGASQLRAAKRLLAAGADPMWTPDYAEGTALDAASGQPTRQQLTIEWLRERVASSDN